jgi:hypothetical protein
MTSRSRLTPSLRANGSRECAPDGRLREAIHSAASGQVDCFVASAFARRLDSISELVNMHSNDVKARLRDLAECFFREVFI